MSQDLLTLSSPAANRVLAEYSEDPLGFMTRCAREFGEIVPFRIEDRLICLLTNPMHITEVLKDPLLFIKAKDLQILHGLLGNGLITSEGDFWQRQRRLTQPVFYHQRINSYGAVMVDYTKQMLQTWCEGEVRDVHDDMMRLTLNIVMKTIFNRDVTDGEASYVAHALDEAMNWFVYQMNNSLVEEQDSNVDRRYQDAIALLDDTIYAMLKHRRSSGEEGEDLLGMLMQVQDADDGSRMSDRQLRDEVASLMLAGHETTANSLSWTWMLLAQHPEVQAKLKQELKMALDGRTPTVSSLSQLPYTHMIIKEAMRLYPPVTDVSREATRDCEIGGYFIPKGCTLIASQWVMHRDPRYFQHPEVFNPERWENDLEKQLPRGVYFPFGDGPRICIGKSFALMEAVLILTTIAQAFELELVPDRAIELQPSITLRPKHGIQVVLKKA
ncbi:cytochrome P450 [Scytonema sp. UIC 10036]|uniref:cytochrome P450 n=1 Tax=Scytonema sp. UIC 10036 TaxID=2304196 RepID=UPI0012DAA0D5|nr:cytochrome P450 [Scytonema sp. UIC 10036]MUG95619.1 cytochrome P450 [Scytonema sp. UIC 10036]